MFELLLKRYEEEGLYKRPFFPKKSKNKDEENLKEETLTKEKSNEEDSKDDNSNDSSISIIVLSIAICCFILYFFFLKVQFYIGLIPPVFIIVFIHYKSEKCKEEKEAKENALEKQEKRIKDMLELLDEFNIDGSSVKEVEKLYKYAKKLYDAKELRNEKYSFFNSPLMLAIVNGLIFPFIYQYLYNDFSKIKNITFSELNVIIIYLFLFDVLLNVLTSSLKYFDYYISKDDRLEHFIKDISSLMLFPEKTKKLYKEVKNERLHSKLNNPSKSMLNK
ncbi:hypothetical protein [Sharpea azabuensis]|uniref:hypothetical protein n=1 Tax=Sharpea azabuensis TaxID=322505 RepID=UPI0013DC2EDA|nr:hypothetical protein [Sharpea azabuensis]